MNKMNMAEHKKRKNNDTMMKVDETKNGRNTRELKHNESDTLMPYKHEIQRCQSACGYDAAQSFWRLAPFVSILIKCVNCVSC